MRPTRSVALALAVLHLLAVVAAALSVVISLVATGSRSADDMSRTCAWVTLTISAVILVVDTLWDGTVHASKQPGR